MDSRIVSPSVPAWLRYAALPPLMLFLMAGLAINFVGMAEMFGVSLPGWVRIGPARPSLFSATQLFGLAGQLLSIALGVLLLAKGRHNRAAVLLGWLLVMFGGTLLGPGSWAPNAATAALLTALWLSANVLFPYLWPVFALEVAGGPISRRQFWFVHGAGAAFGIWNGFRTLAVIYPAAFDPLQAGIAIQTPLLILLNQCFGYGIIAWNYRRNTPSGRNRLKIVVVAFVLYTISTLLLTISPVGFYTAGFALGPAVLTYAVLRRQLFDFGFVLNRTLVYGALSFVLVAAFGLAKWVIEHLIPESWHEGSEYYSVGIALGLFLVLHRVHNWVERNVERVLFSPWHRNEEALRRFVGAAGHFDQTAVLCRAFADELKRFACGVGAAVYLRDRAGSYSLQCASMAQAAPKLDSDDLALALMRAERRPVRIADTHSLLPGALALPMLDHGKLAGLALLEAKGDGTDYRPDEIELLGWAAHQVGLDLQAMRAGELEAEVASLSAQVAALSAQLSAAGARRKRATAA